MALSAGPRQHIVLRSHGYPIAGAPEPPEVGIIIEAREAPGRYGSMPPPWGGIAPGERIWVLYESDIVATAVVDRVTQLAECSANDLRDLAVGYPIHEAEEYWRNLSRSGLLGRLSAVVVWTRDVRRREAPLKRLVRFQHNQHRSKSWVVVNQADDLAEVDARPDVPPAEAVPGEGGAASLEERQLSNAVMGIGCLVILVIALVVLVVVLLIWVF